MQKEREKDVESRRGQRKTGLEKMVGPHDLQRLLRAGNEGGDTVKKKKNEMSRHFFNKLGFLLFCLHLFWGLVSPGF